MDPTIDMFFGLFAIACGVYCIYSAINMKRTQTIDEKILLGNDTKLLKCKDKTALLKEVIPSVLFLGIVAFVYGVFQLVGISVALPPIFNIIGLGVFILATILYAALVTRAVKKYY